ncbi:hypothetical protein [Parasitella parasitica]|uniref:Uncharacterized protein n=1 Tax=Parasitella parasitica TaxID=35722 RepID=A0A0B7NKJ5_9FUNG|nr:hypothetical protein [Parasitella parasitica]
MGAQYSAEVQYLYTTNNGKRVAIPYVRLANGQWVPLPQQCQQWYFPQYPHQQYVNQQVVNPNVANSNVYQTMANPNRHHNDYILPSNQMYFGGYFR